MLRRFEVVLAVLCLVAAAGVASATTYTITDLGNLSGTSVTNVAGIATVGGTKVVVGTAGNAWYWENGTMTSLASTLTTLCSNTGHGTYSASDATGVNASGQIVGYYTNAGGTAFGFAYTLGSGAVNILGSATSYGSVNNNSVNSSGQVFGIASGLPNYNYIFYANGTTNPTQIATGYSGPGGINDSGWTTVKDTPDAFIYNNAGGSWTFTDLGALASYGSSGFGVDAHGDVVGFSGVTGGSATKGHAIYVPYNGNATWGPMVDLGDLTGYYSGYTYGQANAINGSGRIVGYYFNGTKTLATEYAILAGTTSGSVTPLQSYVTNFATSNFGSGSGRLCVADDISSDGYIVGVGLLANGTTSDAFLLTPVPEPSTLLLLASGAIGLLAYAWRKRK